MADDSKKSSLDDLRAIAAAIAERPTASRAGFGAFRKSDDLFRNTVRLILESGLFAPPQLGGAPFWPDPDYWYHFLRRFPASQVRFFKEVLSQPSSYDPTCMWALFWALAKAEHEFLYRFVPFWSHEEGLTGHLLSQMLERIAEFAAPWRALAATGAKGEDSHLRFWYADIATNRQESLTGADLGLVVHAKFGGNEEFLKVLRFQAKKVSRSGRAKIDLDQTVALLGKAGLGYYLFYHAQDKEQWHRPPTVCSAGRFKQLVEERQQKSASRKSLGMEYVNAKDDGYDFASFVTFAFSDPASEHGVLVGSPRDAVSTLTGGNFPGGPPTRILVITMGSEVPPTDWPHLFGEYVGFPEEE
jgi:hypothetical protein